MESYFRLLEILCTALLFAACSQKADSTITSLYVIDAKGGEPKILLSDPNRSYWGPAWSPDGSKLAVTIGDGHGDIYLVNADGSGAFQLTHNGRSNYLTAWSRDGHIISFISQEGDTNTAEIFTIHMDGSNEKHLTDNSAWEYGTSWSVDGTKILFGTERNNEWQIYIMNVDGSNQIPLPTSAHGNAPVWSPDGTKIAFTSNRDGDDDIWVMNSDGSEQQNLTQNDAWDDQPQWSPDGKMIAFTSDRDGTADILVMNSDGSNAINLTKGLVQEAAIPTWSPDGSKLVFHGARRSN